MAVSIEGRTCAEVWENSVRYLVENGNYVASIRGPVLECMNVALVVSNPWAAPRVSSRSPVFIGADAFAESLLQHPRVVDWAGVNQLEGVVSLLLRDPLSRRAVIGIWDPKKDLGLENPQGHLALAFSIRGEALLLTSILRTTDAWMCNWSLAGIPELQRRVYDELQKYPDFRELALGSYTQFHSSFHIYLDDVPHAKLSLCDK